MQPSPGLLKKLTAMFLVEAREHVQALGSGLLELSPSADREAMLPIVEKLFRGAHSLKGAARTINAGEIERLCQKLEAGFSDLKSGQCLLSAPALEELHRSVALLSQRVDTLEAGLPIADCGMRNAESGSKPPSATRNPPSAAPPSAIPERQSAVPQFTIRNPQSAIRNEESVRIAITKLDAIFVQAEEMLAVKLVQAERASELRTLASLVAVRDRLWSESLPWVNALRQQVAVNSTSSADGKDGTVGLLDLTTRLLTLLEQDREHTAAISATVAGLARSLASDRRRFDTLADRLLEDVKKTLMLPCSNILAGFPKMVHDLARDAGKEIQFHLHGTEIEIDKRILEQIKDPLVHLVRNSIDHGIEPPAERVRRRKTPLGSVSVTITQAGGKVEIQIADDGAGIDVAAVKAAAVQAGVIAAGDVARLPDQDARQLVFRSGLTTRREVTTVSGRGLGMAIVQEHVMKLGGTVGIESVPGAGTTVRITLPLTLATLRGTVVRVANREFVIPTANVARVLRITRASVRRVENRDSICLDGMSCALVRLAEVLGLAAGPSAGDLSPELTVLLLDHGQANLAFTVDQVLSEQEVLAKPLGPLLPRVRNLSGATVFGSGRIVPILSVPDLCLTAGGCTQSAVPGPAVAPVRPKRLLVADDSITTRTLLQNILESAGYEVQTAPDGAAAFNTLQSDQFDLVVSDVEMPRMDGFALAKRIRTEPKLAALPVVLVTAREAKEDRERGLDAGANAYLVKSGFDQTSLLETVRRLL
jgi:two-component system chemotaxis sensor kinase CheA